MQSIDLSSIKSQVATLEIAERFFDSVIVFSLFELGVFRELAAGPKTLDEIHARLDGNRDTLEATMDAAVAVKILSRDRGRYRAPEHFLDTLGRPESPAFLGEWVSFLHALAAPLLRLGEATRTGNVPGALFEDMSGDNLPAKRMTQAMDAYARTRGVELAERVDFSRTETLLDLGCGPGTYSLAIMERYPRVRATLLDLPGPIAEAKRLAAARGVKDRVKFVATDATDFAPDEPFDTLLLSNTLHMLGPQKSQSLLNRCFDLLSPGGRIIVQAQYLNDDRTSPRWPTLLNLIQRVGTPDGRNHAIGETTRWLEKAGFRDVDYIRLSLWNVCSCLIAHKP